jgi:dihydroflavonol-4-reductase
MHVWPTLDDGKAEREPGWQPEPVHDSIRRPAQFSPENRLRGKNR